MKANHWAIQPTSVLNSIKRTRRVMMMEDTRASRDQERQLQSVKEGNRRNDVRKRDKEM